MKQHPETQAVEQHYTIAEIASMMRLSRDTVRREFREMPGVFHLNRKGRGHVRGYCSLRIPDMVFRRWYENRVGHGQAEVSR
jgi:AraC-like DNA-binding protein